VAKVKKKYRTTEADFAAFRLRVDWWIEQLGLRGEWERDFTHKNLRDDCYARITADHEAKTAHVELNEDFGPEPFAHGASLRSVVERTALHETLEVLFASLEHLAQRREWDATTWEAAKHAAIHRLERLLLAWDEARRCS
jgi:hypothetical protein